MRYCTLLCALIMTNVFERVLCETNGDFFDSVGDKIKGALVTGWNSVRDFFVTIQPTKPPPNRRKWRKRIWRLTTKKIVEKSTMEPTTIPTLTTPSIQTTPEKIGAVKKHVPMIITPKWVSYKEWNQIQDSPENFKMRIGDTLDVYRKYNFLRDWYVNKPWPASTSNNKNETSTSFTKEISSKENIFPGKEAIVHAYPGAKTFIIRRPIVPSTNTTTPTNKTQRLNLINSYQSHSGNQSARSSQLLSRTKTKILAEIIKLIADKATNYTTEVKSNKTEQITTGPKELHMKSAKSTFPNKNELKPAPNETETDELSVKKLNIEEIAHKLPIKTQEEILNRIADTLVANKVVFVERPGKVLPLPSTVSSKTTDFPMNNDVQIADSDITKMLL